MCVVTTFAFSLESQKYDYSWTQSTFHTEESTPINIDSIISDMRLENFQDAEQSGEGFFKPFNSQV